MEKIKVFLQYPWKYVDSSFYRNLVRSAPKEVEYVNKKNIRAIDSKVGFNINKFLKVWARRIITLLRVPNYIYTKDGDYDLIHCAHCLSLNEKKPWIVDFEKYETLSVNGYYARSKSGAEKIRRILRKPNCKKILPWTEAAKRSMLKYIDDREVTKKIELLPFALPLKKMEIKKERGKVKILFVARYFEPKGGYYAVEVLDKLTKKYDNVEGIIVTEAPNEILEKYKNNKKMKFLGLMGQEELFKVYASSDILFYPGFSDTFGFALVEALMYKLPIITFEGFARDEIVIEGKNGFIVKKPENLSPNWIEIRKKFSQKYADEAARKTEILIKDNKLRKSMGELGYKMIESGKFSVPNRNKILMKIYREALGK